jgi:hypothetical protein
MAIERGETEPLGNWLTRKWHHEHPDPVNEIESLTARVEIAVTDIAMYSIKVEELAEALKEAIQELEASGLCIDHPTIVKLNRALKA